MFLDEAIIIVRSGKGGNGCVSFRREKYIPRGGPNGGNGGNGGSVYLRAVTDITTLLDIGRRRHYIAENGRPGEGNNRHGRRGEDLIIDVPAGTLVREVIGDQEPSEGEILVDLVDPDLRFCAAKGGKGGKGNKFFATATNQVPRQAEEGGANEERRLYLELKLLADVGLVGLPSSGKSTLLAQASAATPKIAAYHFTTLKPNLGIVELSDWRRLLVADIPGLIEGASEGRGLGIEFLRHIERTRVLVHLISAEIQDVDQWVEDYHTIEAELAKYSEELDKRERIVALSKIDLVPPDRLPELQAELSKRLGTPVLAFSAITRQQLQPLLEEADSLVRTARKAEAEEASRAAEKAAAEEAAEAPEASE